MNVFQPLVEHTPEFFDGPEPVALSLGIDLSLTGTGWAIVRPNRAVECGLVKSSGKRGDSLVQRFDRLKGILESLKFTIQDDTVVVIEQPSYSSVGGSHHDRSGLWWMVVNYYLGLGYGVAEVPPATLKKFATGKGNASKDEVLAATIRRYPEVLVTDNNVADAVNLAAMGARWRGFSQEADTLKIGEAMAAVRWPDEEREQGK